MKLISTVIEVPLNSSFGFIGDGTKIEIGDLIYIWERRNRLGLGDEIVYGTAEVFAVLGNDYYTGIRIK